MSESVLTAALSTHALERIAKVLVMAGDTHNASRATAFAAKQREAMMQHAFNGDWLRRLWIGGKLGWLGDNQKTSYANGMFSSPQGWAMLGGAFNGHPAELNRTLANLQTHCRAGWRFGYAYGCDPQVPPTPAASPALQQYPNALGM